MRSRPKPIQARMCGLAIRGQDAERMAEVVEMAVARRDRGRLLGTRDRHHEFVFELLFLLGGRHQTTAAAKKGIVGRHGFDVQADTFEHLFAGLEPVITVLLRLLAQCPAAQTRAGETSACGQDRWRVHDEKQTNAGPQRVRSKSTSPWPSDKEDSKRPATASSRLDQDRRSSSRHFQLWSAGRNARARCRRRYVPTP